MTRTTPPLSSRMGFTLVELSIVLVIVGLLAGGILVGSALIKAAQIRNVISDINRYNAAVYTFQGKYNAIPGDMVNATSIWGQADGGTNGNCANPDTDNANPNGTCNGNGDGLVATNTSCVTDANESFRFWQQLSFAGFVKGAYTGTEGAPGGCDVAVIGVNVPATAIAGSGLCAAGTTGSSTGLGSGYVWGGDGGTNCLRKPAIPPAVAQILDQKLDDGLPCIGKVMVIPSIASDPTEKCVLPAPAPCSSTPSAIYDLTSAHADGPNCALKILKNY